MWTLECDKAFMLLKSKRVISRRQWRNFYIGYGYKNDTIGAVLSQIQNGQERVIACGSRTLSTAERNNCVTRKEILALVFFVKHFKHCLLGREFAFKGLLSKIFVFYFNMIN